MEQKSRREKLINSFQIYFISLQFICRVDELDKSAKVDKKDETGDQKDG